MSLSLFGRRLQRKRKYKKKKKKTKMKREDTILILKRGTLISALGVLLLSSPEGVFLAWKP